MLEFSNKNGNEILYSGGVLMSSKYNRSEKHLASIACSNLPDKPKILVAGLGLGVTLEQLLKETPQDAQIIVVEPFEEVIEWNKHNHSFFNDPRLTIKQAKIQDLFFESGFDLIIMDTDNGPTQAMVLPENQLLYQDMGIKLIKKMLNPNGAAVYWTTDSCSQFLKQMINIYSQVDWMPVYSYYNKELNCNGLIYATDRECVGNSV